MPHANIPAALRAAVLALCGEEQASTMRLPSSATVHRIVLEGGAIADLEAVQQLHSLNGDAAIGIDETTSRKKAVLSVVATGEKDENGSHVAIPVGIAQLPARDAKTQCDAVVTMLGGLKSWAASIPETATASSSCTLSSFRAMLTDHAPVNGKL